MSCQQNLRPDCVRTEVFYFSFLIRFLVLFLSWRALPGQYSPIHSELHKTDPLLQEISDRISKKVELMDSRKVLLVDAMDIGQGIILSCEHA